ncbi:hypothetical protein ACQ5SK_38405 [Bradyrhizobium japonicum]
MAYIISKRDGPHREELKAKDFLQKNRTKINSLANHLTLGRWQELRNPTPPIEPQPSGKLWSTPPARPKEVEPYVRISYNGRVVIADLASGRQLHLSVNCAAAANRDVSLWRHARMGSSSRSTTNCARS